MLHRLSALVIFVLSASAAVAACGGGDDSTAGVSHPPTPGERFCSAIQKRVETCGASSCDQAMVDDCGKLVSVFSDGYLSAAAECVSGGGSVASCLTEALGALQPTDAQHQLASQFCSECLFGAPGCEDAFFSGTGDASQAGKLIEPFGDALVTEIKDQCASSATCAATFLNCAEGVIASHALPENTVTCLVTQLTSGSTDGSTDTCSNSGGAGGAGSTTSAGTGGSTTTTTGTTTSTSSGMYSQCDSQPADACWNCCINVEPNAYVALENDLISECACTIGSTCNTACGDQCGSQTFDQTCIDCLNAVASSTDPCVTTAVNDCGQDATCMPIIACGGSCPM